MVASAESEVTTMGCTHCQSCELYAQFALNPALQLWQTHYCQGDHTRCVRYQMSLRKEPVPLNMLPNGTRVEIPRAADDYNATALFNAILKRRLHMVESLLKTVDVNIRNSEGNTPLMAAAGTGDLRIIRLLLGKGANPGITNNLGETPAQVAARHGHNEAAMVLQVAMKGGPARPKGEPGGFLSRLRGAH